MPDIAGTFDSATRRSLDVVSATEALWLTSRPTQRVRQQLRVGQLEALYEAVYLRIFAAWEDTLEELTVRFLAGYETPQHVPVRLPAVAVERTLVAARRQLFGTRDYLLWHNPAAVGPRVAKFLVGCPVETTVAANRSELEHYAAVRHAIAHSSQDSKLKFEAATVGMVGFKFNTVGRFLRSDDISDPLNPEKRILVIRNRLLDMVADICS